MKRVYDTLNDCKSCNQQDMVNSDGLCRVCVYRNVERERNKKKREEKQAQKSQGTSSY